MKTHTKQITPLALAAALFFAVGALASSPDGPSLQRPKEQPLVVPAPSELDPRPQVSEEKKPQVEAPVAKNHVKKKVRRERMSTMY